MKDVARVRSSQPLGPEPYAGSGDTPGVAWGKGTCRPAIELRKLHPEKTRLIDFGRHAAQRRTRRGEGKPETFDFLGFTHVEARTRSHGRFTVHRYSISKRLRAKLHQISDELRKRLHRPLGETGRWLRRVVQGWLNYHAVPFNSRQMNRFLKGVTRLWLSAFRRRSQRARRRRTWERMSLIAARYLPRPKILHTYPHQRFYARLKVGAV